MVNSHWEFFKNRWEFLKTHWLFDQNSLRILRKFFKIFVKKLADCHMNLLSFKCIFRPKIWAPSEFPEKIIASGGGRNLRLLPKFCTLRSQNLQINLSVKKIDKTICKPIDASFRKTKTCEASDSLRLSWIRCRSTWKVQTASDWTSLVYLSFHSVRWGTRRKTM